MQSLPALIREEVVIADVRSQLRPINQVGMEDQSSPFPFHGGLSLNSIDLPRSHGDDSAVMVVIGCVAVRQISAFDVFQEHAINFVKHLLTEMRLEILKTNHAYQRMQSLHSKMVIIFLNCRYLFHPEYVLFVSKSNINNHFAKGCP